jgi:hypothetical protein
VFVDHFGEGSCADPDAGAGHRGRDPVKRVGLHGGFDPGRDVIALAPVHDEQDFPVTVQPGKDLPQPGLVMRQGLVEQLPAGPVHCRRMMARLPDVQADIHVNVPLLQNHCHTCSLVRTLLTCAGWTTAAGAGSGGNETCCALSE